MSQFHTSISGAYQAGAPWPHFRGLSNDNTGLSPYGVIQNDLNLNLNLNWKFKTNFPVSSSPAIGSDGSVYIGSLDYSIYALSPWGSLMWKYATGYVVSSSPAISLDGTVYVGSVDNSM